MRTLFEKNALIGLKNDLSLSERKKVRMLNIICFVWHLVNIFFVLVNIFLQRINIALICFYGCITVLLVINQYMQFRSHYFYARVLLIFLQFFNHFIISNFIYTGFLIEYFYAIIPLIALHFFDKKILNYGFLGLSIALFYIPNLYFEHYPEGLFGHASSIAIFMIVFFNMKNLKKENSLHEDQLRSQKNNAIKDKNIIEEQRKELEEINNFQSQFFINISHEIRTPLTLILGKSEELKEHEARKYNKKIAAISTGIETQSKKIQQIVDDIIDLAKISANEFQLNLEPVSLHQLLTRICLSFQHLFVQKQISFTYDHTSDCSVAIDTIYMERALNNLMINAIKYTPQGGTIDLSFFSNTENMATITLKDSGIGISKQNLKKIFNRFYQDDNDINRSSGSGIGLAFVKEIIERFNGTIDVESTEGVGSEFRLSLPVVAFNDKTMLQKSIEYPQIDTTPKFSNTTINNSYHKLLVIDDHEEMRKYIISLLQPYQCYEANNGVDALSILEKETIDLVITDYMMPKMNGYYLVKNMRDRKINVSILMLTARTDMQGKVEMLRLGLDDYITKPFNKEELRIRVRKILKNNSARNTYLLEEKSIENTLEDDKLTHELELFVIENCKNPDFGLEEIVNEFAISKSSLYRKVKMATGLSPNEFINEIKLQHTRHILNDNSNITLKELAYQVGFKQPQYFSRLYEKRFGIKPFQNKNSEFRI